MALELQENHRINGFSTFHPSVNNLTDDRGLSSVLKHHTKQIHTEAERSGIIKTIIRGNVKLQSYLLWLQSMQPIYEKMEMLLEENRHLIYLSDFYHPEMFRAHSLATDIDQIISTYPDLENCSELNVKNEYLGRLNEIDISKQFSLLIAHIYVRYLGDLSGGQIIEKILSKQQEFSKDNLSFYKFANIVDLNVFKNTIRGAIDNAAIHVNTQLILDEALRVFRYNINLSKEVMGSD